MNSDLLVLVQLPALKFPSHVVVDWDFLPSVCLRVKTANWTLVEAVPASELWPRCTLAAARTRRSGVATESRVAANWVFSHCWAEVWAVAEFCSDSDGEEQRRCGPSAVLLQHQRSLCVAASTPPVGSVVKLLSLALLQPSRFDRLLPHASPGSSSSSGAKLTSR